MEFPFKIITYPIFFALVGLTYEFLWPNPFLNKLKEKRPDKIWSIILIILVGGLSCFLYKVLLLFLPALSTFIYDPATTLNHKELYLAFQNIFDAFIGFCILLPFHIVSFVLYKKTGCSQIEFDEIDHDLFRRIIKLTQLRQESKRYKVDFEFCRTSSPYEYWAIVTCITREGMIRSYALAALPCRPDKKSLADFEKAVHNPYGKINPHPQSLLVYNSQKVDEGLASQSLAKGISLISLMEYQGLMDFSKYLQTQKHNLKADKRYHPDLYVTQNIRWKEGHESRIEKDALAALQNSLRVPYGCLVVLFGDSGSGKTFTLHMLALCMELEKNYLKPILIDMKNLEKSTSLDGLVSPHLVKYLGYYDSKLFKHMLKEGHIALLFDGFDELAPRITFDRALEYFDTIIDAAGGKAKVIVTCRSQHILSDLQLLTKLSENAHSLKSFRLGRLELFTKDQIKTFLEKRDIDGSRGKEKYNLLEKFTDLQGLCTNPQMLGFLSEISVGELTDAAHGIESRSVAQLYRLLVNRWLDRERERLDFQATGSVSNLEWLWQIVTELAILLWTMPKHMVSFENKPEKFEQLIARLTPSNQTEEIIEHLIGAETLLIRIEEKYFRFVHDSIMEFLVGKAAADELLDLRKNQTPIYDIILQPTQMVIDSFQAELENEDIFEGFIKFNKNPSAAPLLYLCTCFANEVVPHGFLADHLDLLPADLQDLISYKDEFDNIVQQFVNCRLAVADEAGLYIHPLIRALVRAQEKQTRRKWARLALSIVARSFPKNLSIPKNWEVCKRILSHTLSAIYYAIELSVDDMKLSFIDGVGSFCFMQGKYMDAQSCFEYAHQRANAAAESKLQQTVWKTNQCVAGLMKDNSEHEISPLNEALEINSTELDLGHNRHLASIHANLGHAFYSTGQKDDAITHLLCAYELIKSCKSQQAIHILDSIGMTLLALGRYEEGLRCLRVSRCISKKLLSSEDHNHAAVSAIRSLLIAHALNSCKQAERAQREKDGGIRIWKEVLNDLHQMPEKDAYMFARKLGNTIKEEIISIGSHWDLLNNILERLKSNAMNLEQKHGIINAEWKECTGKLESIEQNWGYSESVRATSTLSYERVDLEADEVELKKQTEEAFEEATVAWQILVDWQKVIDTFVVRYMLQVPPCGLCEPKDCLFCKYD